jgi:hypothetical protein
LLEWGDEFIRFAGDDDETSIRMRFELKANLSNRGEVFIMSRWSITDGKAPVTKLHVPL